MGDIQLKEQPVYEAPEPVHAEVFLNLELHPVAYPD